MAVSWEGRSRALAFASGTSDGVGADYTRAQALVNAECPYFLQLRRVHYPWGWVHYPRGWGTAEESGRCVFQCSFTGEGTRSTCWFLESALTIKQQKMGTTFCTAPALWGSSGCHYLLSGRKKTWQEVLPWLSSLDRLVASGGLGWRAISEPQWIWKWAGCWTVRLVRPEALPREEQETSQVKRLAPHCPHLTSGQSEPESLTRVANPAPVGFPWVSGSPWMIHGGSQGWGTGWGALGDSCSRALRFFPSLAAQPSKSLAGRMLCCRPVGGRAGGGTTQHITAREEKRILHQGLCNFWHVLHITIQYQGAHAVPCHVSRAHFRQSLLNDIPVLSELLQFHVSHVLLGQLLGSRVLCGTRLELHVTRVCAWPVPGEAALSSFFSSLQKEGGSWTSPWPHCRPAPDRTWFAFNCISGVGILLWEAKSLGTVTRPNPSLLALWPLMAFPYFTWDWALKCFLQTWPTPSSVCWGSFSHWNFAYSKWTPQLDFFFPIFFFSFCREKEQVKVHHMYSLGRARGSQAAIAGVWHLAQEWAHAGRMLFHCSCWALSSSVSAESQSRAKSSWLRWNLKISHKINRLQR